VPHPFPTRVFLEPTDACNLGCIMCPSGRERHPASFIDYKLALEILQLLAPTSPALHLYEWGEPLLHPRIFDLIETAVSLKFQTRFSTNLNNVKPEVLRFLAGSGLRRIRVSLDAATNETYAQIRRGGNFQQVLDNLRTLISLRNQFNRQRPQVELAFIIMQQNQHEIQAFKELALSLGVDRLRYKTLIAFNDHDLNNLLPSEDHLHCYSHRTSRPKIQTTSCAMPFTGCLIGADGSVYPCGFSKASRQNCFGNLYQKSFTEIWNSNEAQQMRQSIQVSPQYLSPCNHCTQAVHPIRDQGWDTQKFNRL